MSPRTTSIFVPRRIGLSARRHGNEKQDSIFSIGSDGGRPLLQTMPNFGRGQSVADACKGTRIPRERREAPNPLYLPGVGEGSSYLATPFHPSGNRSPGAPDGGGCG